MSGQLFPAGLAGHLQASIIASSSGDPAYLYTPLLLEWNNCYCKYMKTLSVTYASSPSADLLIPTLEFKNEAAGVIRLAQSFNDLTATT